MTKVDKFGGGFPDISEFPRCSKKNGPHLPIHLDTTHFRPTCWVNIPLYMECLGLVLVDAYVLFLVGWMVFNEKGWTKTIKCDYCKGVVWHK